MRAQSAERIELHRTVLFVIWHLPAVGFLTTLACIGVRKAQTQFVSSALAVGNQSVCRVASCSVMNHTACPDKFSSLEAIL